LERLLAADGRVQAVVLVAAGRPAAEVRSGLPRRPRILSTPASGERSETLAGDYEP
jgi:hypothetical protein